ncbi:MAG: flagellar hook protein FlgE [Colwellia sp.]|nr:flagellar hook protein FlgE [Colwellia sp.]
MSFNIALSGLNAAQKDLDVTSNNIANVNTIGFKESRAEFVDVYASSLLSGGKTKAGDGVLTSEVAQQFSQGSIKFTQNSLDLAITGTGFYATVPGLDSLEKSYTRAGQFKLNDDNFVVNSASGYLLGFPVNEDGSSSSVSLSTATPIRIPTSSGAPQFTTEVDVRMNLPAGDPYITGAPLNFDPTDPLTFNNSTSVTVFDSLGDSHVMTYYFVKDNPNDAPGPPLVAGRPNEWIMFTAIDGNVINLSDPAADAAAAAAAAGNPDPFVTATAAVASADALLVAALAAVPNVPADVDAANLAVANAAQQLINATTATVDGRVSATGLVGGRLTFNSSGDFTAISPTTGFTTIALGDTILANGADPAQAITIDFNLDIAGPNPNEPTQFASNFEVTSLSQNGLAVGRLTGIDIGSDGLIRATYSNGTSQPLARIALVTFANEQGLTQIGGTAWRESLDSGEPLAGEANSGTFGTINSKALEQANVNLTTELIDLISAQRNFQANSRALEVNNQLNQTILQIR